MFRPADIVISTPAKCGTTWLQMICALKIFQRPTFDQSLDWISPWLDFLARPLDEVLADLEGQTHRRFIKTHTPLDVAVSWVSHFSNLNLPTFFALREAGAGPIDFQRSTPTERGRARALLVLGRAARA